MDADAILRVYPVGAFPTAKDAVARLAGDAEVVCEARRVARVLHHDGAPVYFYSFEYGLPGVGGGRAFHGLESNFLFGNNFAVNPNLGITAPRALSASDLVIYDTMSTFWRRFMDSGDPNPRGVPEQWPPYRPLGATGFRNDDTDRHYVFADRLGIASHLRDSPCNFWEAFYFRSAFGAVPAVAR
jgi:carboxylesterase type B